METMSGVDCFIEWCVYGNCLGLIVSLNGAYMETIARFVDSIYLNVGDGALIDKTNLTWKDLVRTIHLARARIFQKANMSYLPNT